MKTKRFTIYRTASGTFNRKPFSFTREIELDAKDAETAQQRAADLFVQEKEGVVVAYRVEQKKAESPAASSANPRTSSRRG